MAQPIDMPDEMVLPEYIEAAMAKIPSGAMLPSAPALSEMPTPKDVEFPETQFDENQ